MSEKIYAWLLRLYPAHFRRAYGEDALQLLRDRARDETGFLAKLRLWLDLAADLALSAPGQHMRVLDRQPLQTAPCFQLLANETPRRAALVSGGLIALVTLGVLPFLLSHSGGYGHVYSSVPEPLSFPDAQSQPHPPPPMAPGDPLDRKRAIERILEDLKQYYVDAEVAQKMAGSLRAHEKAGDYARVADAPAFAGLLTAHLQEVSHDFHLMVKAMPSSAGAAAGPPREVLALFRREMQRTNCTFEGVGLLPDQIGYLKLNAFPPPLFCGSVAAAAMAKLKGARAIIFDLRYNRGGSPEMVTLLESYLFAQPTRLDDIYDRADRSTRQTWTAPVPGNQLADKPAYVLVSRGTVSAAEAFAYDLKLLRRATVVGETTAGAAHIARAFRVDERLTILIPVAKPVNPISKTDWEGKGVTPDVRASPKDALAVAERLAESRK